MIWGITAFIWRHSDEVESILTHWGRVTHICVANLTIIGSDNSLSPGRRQAIIWTNARILLIGPLGTNFSEILVETFSPQKNAFKSVVCEMAAILSRPQYVNKDYVVSLHSCCPGRGLDVSCSTSQSMREYLGASGCLSPTTHYRDTHTAYSHHTPWKCQSHFSSTNTYLPISETPTLPENATIASRPITY